MGIKTLIDSDLITICLFKKNQGQVHIIPEECIIESK